MVSVRRIMLSEDFEADPTPWRPIYKHAMHRTGFHTVGTWEDSFASVPGAQSEE